MLAKDSPFECGWWGSSLASVGLGDVRPYLSTYGRYDYQRLPTLPLELNGQWQWLKMALRHPDHIDRQRTVSNQESVPALPLAAQQMGIALPKSLGTFLQDLTLAHHLRSNTDCFLDVGKAPVPSPKGGGSLLRFLCDSQGCVMWYVYLTADGSDHAVVSSTDFYGTEEELELAVNWVSDQPDPDALLFCAESFEEFVGRFWLENEIWFADCRQEPMLEVGTEYIRRYHERQVQLAWLDVRDWSTPARFFPWSHVQRWINRVRPGERGAVGWQEAEPALQAHGCPECGRKNQALEVVMVLSPESDWECGQGQLGFLTLCAACHLQVGFELDLKLTEQMVNRWQEEHKFF